MQETFIEAQVDKVSEEKFRTYTVEVNGGSPSKTAVRRAKQKLIKFHEEDQKRDSSFMLLKKDSSEILMPLKIEDLLE